MLQSKGRYNLDCVNAREHGSVWGTITTLENINSAVQERGLFKARIEFCGILEEYNGNRWMFFKDYGSKEEDNYFVELRISLEVK